MRTNLRPERPEKPEKRRSTCGVERCFCCQKKKKQRCATKAESVRRDISLCQRNLRARERKNARLRASIQTVRTLICAWTVFYYESKQAGGQPAVTEEASEKRTHTRKQVTSAYRPFHRDWFSNWPAGFCLAVGLRRLSGKPTGPGLNRFHLTLSLQKLWCLDTVFFVFSVPPQ